MRQFKGLINRTATSESMIKLYPYHQKRRTPCKRQEIRLESKLDTKECLSPSLFEAVKPPKKSCDPVQKRDIACRRSFFFWHLCGQEQLAMALKFGNPTGFTSLLKEGYKVIYFARFIHLLHDV
jgi:hypothetical protein